jgi:hypothetical protein
MITKAGFRNRSDLNEDPETAIYHSADTNAGFAIIQNANFLHFFSPSFFKFQSFTFYKD